VNPESWTAGCCVDGLTPHTSPLLRTCTLHLSTVRANLPALSLAFKGSAALLSNSTSYPPPGSHLSGSLSPSQTSGHEFLPVTVLRINLEILAVPLKSPHSFKARQGSAGANTALCTFSLLAPVQCIKHCTRSVRPVPSRKLIILVRLRKFGKQIQKRQLEVPEYAASFVNYKALKKVC